jgi:hypothetical protein
LVELYARDASCTNNIAIIITIVTVDAIHQTQFACCTPILLITTPLLPNKHLCDCLCFAKA